MSAQLVTYTKAPADILDYEVNWLSWLAGDTIASSAWTATTGVTLVSDSNTTTSATARISGGVIGTRYLVTNTIVAAGGEQKDQSFWLEIRAE